MGDRLPYPIGFGASTGSAHLHTQRRAAAPPDWEQKKEKSSGKDNNCDDVNETQPDCVPNLVYRIARTGL